MLEIMFEHFTSRVGREGRCVALDMGRSLEGFGVSDDDNRDTRISTHTWTFPRYICVA